MKFIIKESQLDIIMTDYLNTWIENKNVSNHMDFIQISQKTGYDDNDWTDWMEYDFSDGRLWINNEFKRFMSDLFAMSVLDIIPFLTKWFENKFNVDVEYTE
jgi:predicted N-acyltransferase